MAIVRIIVVSMSKLVLAGACFELLNSVGSLIENEITFLLIYYFLAISLSFILTNLVVFVKASAFIHLITNTTLVGVLYAIESHVNRFTFSYPLYVTDLLSHAFAGLVIGLLLFKFGIKWIRKPVAPQ